MQTTSALVLFKGVEMGAGVETTATVSTPRFACLVE